MHYFITGTSTDAGKTYITALLTRYLRTHHQDAVAIKPISCGSQEDSLELQKASDKILSLSEINFLHYEAPLAPMQAALATGEHETDFSATSIIDPIKKLATKHTYLLVEGVGGWLVPITPSYTTADLAAEMGFPVLLVVRNRLGALNHTLLTLESIRSHGLRCAGILVNHHPKDEGDLSQPGNRTYFKELGVEVYGEIYPDRATFYPTNYFLK